MNRIFATCWRWVLILLVYLVLAVPIVGIVLPGAAGQSAQVPMIFQGILRSAAYNQGFFPDNVYYADWQLFCSSYAMNCLYISLLFVVLWNVLYAPFALGRNHENSARAMIWVFSAAHVAVFLGYAFYVFTLGSHVWNWLITQPMGLSMMLLLPILLVIPFYLTSRALGPYRLYNVFPMFAPIRSRLGLRVYSRRGAMKGV